MESMTAEVIIGNGVQTDGFAIVEGVISRATVDNLLIALERIGDTRIGAKAWRDLRRSQSPGTRRRRSGN
jgi:hypothetical protein